MKQVFNNSEIAHIWAAQQQTEGRTSCGNFYFRNQTVFSYGSHFPIAVIVGNDVIFTMRSYSNTTAKHIGKVRRAVSHKNIIWCYDIPVDYKESNKGYFKAEHDNNLNRWKREIKSLFGELGNKRIRDVQSRVNAINNHISKLQAYCNYFKVKIEDKELKGLLKLAQSDNFIESARASKDKANEAHIKKMQLAGKAYSKYLEYWREGDLAVAHLSPKIKELSNYYLNQIEAFTRLRYNSDHNRIETSKGVQIPCDIAKRAFIALNGCMKGSCNELNIPVMSYTITKTDKDTITAGCHTIPKEDIKYIAQLLNW